MEKSLDFIAQFLCEPCSTCAESHGCLLIAVGLPCQLDFSKQRLIRLAFFLTLYNTRRRSTATATVNLLIYLQCKPSSFFERWQVGN